MLPQNKSSFCAESHNLYLIQCCPIGGSVWTFTAGYRDPMPWATAARVADDLTQLSSRVVYRPVRAGSAQ